VVGGLARERLAARLQRGGDVGGQYLIGKHAHLVEVLRWFDLGHAEGGHHPATVLVLQHPAPEGIRARRPRDDHSLLDEPARDVDVMGGVGDPDVDGVLAGSRKPSLGQPHW